MKIFISWSGKRSHDIALALGDWLKDVIQILDPFVSSDIDKGVTWFNVIGESLKNSSFGVLCLTPENLNSDWVLFEAGALFKGIPGSRVVPLLFNIKPSDLTGPLSQFQSATDCQNVEQLFQLASSINNLIDNKLDEDRLRKAVNRSVDDFLSKIEGLSKFEDEKKDFREDREVLDEILNLSRNLHHLFRSRNEILKTPKLLQENFTQEFQPISQERENVKMLLEIAEKFPNDKRTLLRTLIFEHLENT
jgi:hypothetical protein